jgi:hypothetical protein
MLLLPEERLFSHALDFSDLMTLYSSPVLSNRRRRSTKPHEATRKLRSPTAALVLLRVIWWIGGLLFSVSTLD